MHKNIHITLILLYIQQHLTSGMVSVKSVTKEKTAEIL